MLKGRIIKNISNTYVVKAKDKNYNCTPRGKFRNLKLTPLVGDIVEFDENNNYILNINKRINELDRPNISNIDYALIVVSLKEPDLSLNLLDKELCSIILSNIKPIICFTKLDLIKKQEKEELERIIKYYKNLDIPIFTNDNLEPLKEFLNNKYIVLTGQTGAGKSSLINRLDETKNLKTGEVSKALNRGRHTTRHTEFYEINNFYIADTPGFSSLDLKKYSKEQIRDSFKEFNKKACKYKDCMHLKEDMCDVKKEIESGSILKSRYDNYEKFINELK